MARRVVVTGTGLVTPLGIGSFSNWKNLLNGIIGIKKLSDPRYVELPCQIAGTVPLGKGKNELDKYTFFSESDLRNTPPGIVYALVAADEALKDASWVPNCLDDLQSTGVSIGTGMSDLNIIVETASSLQKKYSRVSPYFIPMILPNMPAGRISIKYGFQGPNHAVSTACATGCHAIGDAFRMIKDNDAEVMVCGGTEASISPLGIAGFCRIRALATKFNDNPESGSRPFDELRDGFVMGEGAGVLILEELEHAQKRNAKIYAEIIGYGMSGDAFHITAPRPDGLGALRAMQKAISNAGISEKMVKYVNAHATSTPLGDDIEVNAIKKLFGSHSKNLLVSSNKGSIGHLLGAAGAVEAIFTVLSCHTGFVPPTVNLDNSSAGMDLDFVPNEGKIWKRELPKRIALCNSFGFGGTNASLCIASYEGY